MYDQSIFLNAFIFLNICASSHKYYQAKKALLIQFFMSV